MKNITGQKFNRLTAIEFVNKDKFNHPHWSFKCDCGNIKVINLYSVTSGKTKSCGCLDKEKHTSHPNRKHMVTVVKEFTVFGKL